MVEAQFMEVIEKPSGQDAVAAIADLHGLYDRIRRTSDEGKLRTDRRIERLTEVLIYLSQLHEGLGELQGVVKRLRTLSTVYLDSDRNVTDGEGGLRHPCEKGTGFGSPG